MVFQTNPTFSFVTKPLSDKHKKYVQNLDIEADARLLRERLSLCEEAVDYFRASSSLLKAGVAAGLTLYDIAILCCRNDNLAEEPSMMEKLFDMASELALVAVENERWHHSAASRALVEQLIPRRRSSLLNADDFVREASRRFSRSISSVEMASLPSHPSDQSLNRETMEPGMAQSSGSDSSSDHGDGSLDKEECEEWAAELIADLTEHQMIPIGRPERSSSVSSDDSSDDGSQASGSIKGFWVIPPGSSQARIPDDGSFQWSPKSSPRESLDIVDLLPTLSFGKGNENSKSDPKTPTVTFADSSSFLPPATVDVHGCGMKDADFSDMQKLDSGGMTRSKSYSALSATTGRVSKKSVSSSARSPSKFTEQYEHYRKYFHKFIDLVIVRETTAALHHSKHAAVNLL